MTSPQAGFFRRMEALVQEQVPLSAYTTLKVGGPAKWFMEVRSLGDLRAALALAKDHGIPVLPLGRGSNLLVRDQGFEGLVLHFGDSFSDCQIKGERLIAQAGASTGFLARAALNAGLQGLAFGEGIPASLGGAALMNAGAFGGEMSQVLESLVCLDRAGEIKELPASEAGYGYRHSRMMETGDFILSAVLRLSPGDPQTIKSAMADYRRARSEKQPLRYPSAGSYFKRPPGHFAGALIEQAGLKGLRVGDAQVSELHAGFLINLGKATADDFLRLQALVQQAVWERFSIQLEPEVRII